MLAKVDPIKMVRKSKKMSLDELDLDSIKLEKGDFSIEDLKDNGNNAKRHNLLKLVLDSSSACQLSDACNAVCGRSCVLEGIKRHQIHQQQQDVWKSLHSKNQY